MGWLGDWAKRIKITIDHNDVDASLSHFPVLLYLSSSSGITGVDVTPIFDEVGANSKKIAVTKSDGTTQLYVEIEKWDSVNEKAWLWISRSGWNISNTVDTDIYIYYDNSQPNNTTYVDDVGTGNAVNVWDSDFVLVCHMTGGVGDEIDSTSYGNTITEVGTVENTIGQLGSPARDFLGSDDYFTIPSFADGHFGSGPWTLEAWVHPDDINEVQRIIDWGSHSLRICCISLDSDATVYVQARDADLDIMTASSTTSYTATAWWYIAGKRSDNTVYICLDGVNENSATNNLTGVITALDTKHIGVRGINLTLDLDAQVDEIRVSKIARSDAWIKVSYESGRDHFVTYGSEETPPVKGKPSSIIPLMRVMDLISAVKRFPKFKPRLVA